ncbi:cob(I)yrinic acid a,c-diamide adenosyltransferase [Candidatus Woesearchaeota archaeon]|nr:MAG: cob(I)yrinic acid a,c-diamide adenosyltransferase [Candidatus Woesearchaeota archaeon]
MEMNVVTGNGKGKTTMTLGVALRALGYGMKVEVVQFLKGRKTGLVKFAEKYKDGLKVNQFGRKQFVMEVKEVDKKLAKDALTYVSSIKKADIVILDEVNVALSMKVVGLDDVVKAVRCLPKNTVVYFTGRNAPRKLCEMADSVVEVRYKKEPKYMKARKGIEY